MSHLGYYPQGASTSNAIGRTCIFCMCIYMCSYEKMGMVMVEFNSDDVVFVLAPIPLVITDGEAVGVVV